jgi:ATP-dependent protease ClpP protease subunit
MPNTAPRKRSQPAAKQPGLVVNAAGKTAEILLYEEIGYWGITARQFIQALIGLGDVEEITLRINSLGGEVFDAVAIYNALYSHPAKIIARVDGVAASAAGFVLQAADVRQMVSNATFHTHPAQGGVFGSADEIEQYLMLLRNVDEIIGSIFAARTGLDEAELKGLLGKDTWLKADEALQRGFIDEVIDATDARQQTEPANQSTANARPPDLDAARETIKSLSAIAEELGARPVSKSEPTPAPVVNQAPPASPPAAAPVATPAEATPAAVEPALAPEAPPAKPINQSAEIVRLCVACGVPAKAADFLDAQTPLDQVRAQLLEMQIASRPVSPTPPGNFDQRPKQPEDPDAKFKAEYAATEKVFQRQGVTVEAYVKSRRKDEGLE